MGYLLLATFDTRLPPRGGHACLIHRDGIHKELRVGAQTGIVAQSAKTGIYGGL